MQHRCFKQVEPKHIDDEDPPQTYKAPRPRVDRSTTDKYGFITELKHSDSLARRQQINARIEKWREMLPKLNTLMASNSSLLKERARKGIPDGLRTLVWPLLAEKSRMQTLCSYNPSPPPNAYSNQIELDVRRTFPDNVNFQAENICVASLSSVLNALSTALPQLGYCQGMNFITGSLLIVTSDENAFWILYSFIVKYKQLDKYIEPSKVLRQFYVFERLIEQFFPKLELNVDTFIYATDWFMTLFASVLPLPLLYRVYDIFLVEGEKTLYRCALTILQLKLAELKQCDGFEETAMCLKHKGDMAYYDHEEFIRIMTKQFIFSKSRMADLYAAYDKRK